MRNILIGIVAMFLSHAAVAQDRAGIETTIQSQMDAFVAGDVATAFSFASPSIQRLFGSPERFGKMVQDGYPMVWQPSDVEFLSTRDRGDIVLQKVQVRDMSGVPYTIEYAMIFQDGTWRINGVQLLAAPPVGA